MVRLAEEHTDFPVPQREQISDCLLDGHTVIAGHTGERELIHRGVDEPVYPQISQATYKNVNQALAGQMSPEDALAAADEQINQALATL
jgi:hypothetical protein